MKRAMILLLVLAITLDGGDLRGCGWYFEGEEYRFWLLQPELTGTVTLHPFHFTTTAFNGPDIDVILEAGYRINVLEWQGIVGNSIAEEEIREVLYGFSAIYFRENEEQLFQHNAFLKKLVGLKGGWPEFIRYAKECEALVSNPDPWESASHDPVALSGAWDRGQILLTKARDPRLRARIAYQLVRCAHYGAEVPINKVQAVYKEHLAPMQNKTWLEASAAFYIASMMSTFDRDLEFGRIFDKAVDKQFRMVQLFHSAGIRDYIQKADDDRHKATLMVMRDLQHPGRALSDLEQIARWDPSNAHLPMLITREVNKLEDWLLTPALTNLRPAIRQWQGVGGLTESKILQVDLDYLQKVKDFIGRIQPQSASKDQPLLTLLDGHLSLIAGDFEDCRELLTRIERDGGATPAIRVQARIGRILAGIMAEPQLSDTTRNDLLELIALVNDPDVPLPHERSLVDQLHLYLGKKLIQRGEIAEGIFLLARSARVHSNTISYSANARHVAFEQAAPEDLDRMIAYLDKADKTPFESYLTATDERPEHWPSSEVRYSDIGLTRDRLLDLKAMWYVDRDRLEEALAVLREIPDELWTTWPYSMFASDDPFVVDLEDPHNYQKKDNSKYNKRTIIERLIELKREAARSPSKRGMNNYLLGNAYYNMSWHGKYWIMMRLGWSIHDRAESGGPSSDAHYFGSARARPYYIAAQQYAKYPVMKAMAHNMVNVCTENWSYYNLGQEELTPAKELTDRRSLNAYREIIECIGYQDHVRRFR